HPSSAITGEARTFHFALVSGMNKDNRIPPKGFRIAEAAGWVPEPSPNGSPAPNLFSASEYAGGHDDVALSLPPGGTRLRVELYYQQRGREYIDFLRDETKGTAKTLKSPTPSGEPQAYIAQTDPFFAQLSA